MFIAFKIKARTNAIKNKKQLLSNSVFINNEVMSLEKIDQPRNLPLSKKIQFNKNNTVAILMYTLLDSNIFINYILLQCDEKYCLILVCKM